MLIKPSVDGYNLLNSPGLHVAGHINNQYNTCFWMLVKSGKSKSEAQRTLKVLFSTLFLCDAFNYTHCICFSILVNSNLGVEIHDVILMFLS